MKNPMFYILPVFLILFVQVLTCTKEDKVFNENDIKKFESTLSGVVVNKNGTGLSNVVVTAHPRGITTLTDINGQFTIPSLSGSKYLLNFSLVDYLDTALIESVQVNLLENKTLKEPMKMTYRYGCIKGYVMDDLYNPFFNAGVKVEKQNVSTRSHSEGEFTLLRVEPGYVRLFGAIKNIGYGTAEIEVISDSSIEDVNIVVIRKGGKVSGCIVDTYDKPVVGARVSAIGGALETLTYNAGRFELNGIPSEGSVTLTVTVDSITMHIHGVSVKEGYELDIGNITFQGGVIEGDIRLIPSVIFATTADTNVILLVEAVTSDSLIKILHYEWDIDNNSVWDMLTPTCRLRISVPPVGTNTVKVRCMSTDSSYSAVVGLYVKVKQVNKPAKFTVYTTDMTDLAFANIEYKDTVEAEDKDGDSVIFSFEESPDSMKLDSNIITWMPVKGDTGVSHVTVKVTDGKGEYDFLEWEITVIGSLSVPEIIKHPEDTTVLEGDDANFSVFVNGSYLTYQWQKDTLYTFVDTLSLDTTFDTVWIDISFISDSVYTIFQVELSDSGFYRCIVRNCAGRDTSDSAQLIVNSITTWIPDSLEYNNGMVKIIGNGYGFSMGSDVDAEEQPVHKAKFTYDFWMDTTEVTQGDYDALMSATYSGYLTPAWSDTFGVGDNKPAYYVNWYDAVLYCNALSKRDALDTVYIYDSISGTPGDSCILYGLSIDFYKTGCRLPTEAEWEYVCRGGTTTIYYWGDVFDESYVWYEDNSGDITNPVGTKLPNAYGLYDMSGNVDEWCNDWYGSYKSSTQTDPTGPGGGTKRVVRGGSWNSNASNLRSAYRTRVDPELLFNNLGFRVVLPIE